MNKRIWTIFISFLILISILLCFAVFNLKNDGIKLIACDVGQGDAFLIQHKNTQILVDAGKGERVLSCLSKYMPFWDKQIELAVITHPQEDHYGGFIKAFTIYSIETLLYNGQESDSESFKQLKENIDKSTKKIVARSGGKIKLKDFYINIVHPGEVLDENENNNSVMFILETNSFSAFFTGDSENSVWTPAILSKLKDIDVLKVPHHGSKNGLSEELVKVTKPEIALIGVGKNSYGHPTKEILDILKKYKVTVRRTDTEGNVVLNFN